MALKVTIARTIEEFSALKQQWDLIYDANPTARIFQSFDWNFTAWTVYHQACFENEKLYVVYAVMENRDERAIFPFYITAGGCLKFIATDYSDVQNAVYPEHDGNWHVFFADVAGVLARQREFKSVDLSKMEDDSEVLKYFGVYWLNQQIVRMQTYSYQPFPRTDDLSRCLSHLQSKDRTRIRSQLKKGDVFRLKIYSVQNCDEYPFDLIKQLRDTMVIRGFRSYSSLPDELFTAIGVIYNQGGCELSGLFDERGNLVFIGFRLINKGNRISFWIALYSERKLTSIGYAMYIAEKIRDKPCVIDWGTGAYRYKLELFRPHVRHLYAIRSYPVSFKDCWRRMRSEFRHYVKMLLISMNIIKTGPVG